MNDGAYVWLLPHPGDERKPERGGCDCPWPPEDGSHRRKFLCVDGEARNSDGKKVAGPMGVWVEYEPPTRVVDKSGSDPRYIHEVVTRVSTPTLNTDPWVFHPGFVWSVCKHKESWDADTTPNTGDVVLFGSSKGRRAQARWILDTVFVVDKRISSPVSVQSSPNYKNLVAPVLPSCQPFVGRTFKTVVKPFSFAPCRLSNKSELGFLRPCIDDLLDELERTGDATPSSGNSRSLTRCWTKNRLRFWKDLVELVFNKRLMLGSSFDLPRIIVTNDGSSPTTVKCPPNPKHQGRKTC